MNLNGIQTIAGDIIHFVLVVAVARDAVTPPARGISLVMGTSLVALGVMVALYAAVRFHRGLANAAAGRPVRPKKGVPTEMGIAVALALIGA